MLSTALTPHGLQRMIWTSQRHPPQLVGASWTGRSQPPRKAHGGLGTSRVLHWVLLMTKTPSAWTKWTLCGWFLPLACLSPHAVSNQYHTSSSFQNLYFLSSALTGTFPTTQDNRIFPLWLSGLLLTTFWNSSYKIQTNVVLRLKWRRVRYRILICLLFFSRAAYRMLYEEKEEVCNSGEQLELLEWCHHHGLLHPACCGAPMRDTITGDWGTVRDLEDILVYIRFKQAIKNGKM